jgi:hypothetical protein
MGERELRQCPEIKRTGVFLPFLKPIMQELKTADKKSN